MKQSPVAGIVVLVMLLLGVPSAASALTLPEILTETGKYPVKFEGIVHSVPEIETTNPLKIICEKLKMTGEITSAHAGTYKFDLEPCVLEPGRLACGTSGDAVGVLLWSGEFHPVWLSVSTTLKVGFLMSLPKLSGCLGEFGTHENKGYLIPVTPINTFTTHPSLPAKTVGPGIQEYTSYYNESFTLVAGAYLQLVQESREFALRASLELTTEKAVNIYG